MIESLKTGLWLTPERMRTYPILLLSLFSAAILLLIVTGHGNYDRTGRPLGPDFSDIWVAGQDVIEGHAVKVYEPAAHKAKQADFFGETPDFYIWSYPPYFLGVAALVAFLPYLLALFLWQAATLPLYLAAVWAISRPSKLPVAQVLVSAAAFPAVFVNLSHGQNGFLTAALLAGGLLNLKTRPLLAGVLFAGLAYKPQYAVMIPVALIAGGYWRTILSGSIALGLFTLATLVAFGSDVWVKFPQAMGLSKNLVLDQGGAGFEKMQSVFAACRLLGVPVDQAYLIQAVALGTLICGIAWLWRSAADDRLKAAALLTGALLATPYSFDYDMVILGPALAFAVSYGMEKGFRAYEKTLFALIWICPLIARPLATAASIPIGAFLMILLFAMLIWRAGRETAAWSSMPVLKEGIDEPSHKG